MLPTRFPIVMLLLIVILLTAGCMIGDQIYPIPIPTKSPVPTTTRIPSPQDQPSGYWIHLDTPGDKREGDVFIINATTNLSSGEEILVEVIGYDSMMHHSKAYQGEFHGAASNVKVITGSDGNNTISFLVNSTEEKLIPQQYFIYESAVNENATGESQFNITPIITP